MSISTIDQLIGEGHLQKIPGPSDHKWAFLDLAREHLAGADVLLQNAPGPALSLSFSAVRSALLGVLAHHHIALTETSWERTDQDNDEAIIAATTELVGADRFPELDELRKANADREYGPTPITPRTDAPRWVAVAGTIVAAGEELIA